MEKIKNFIKNKYSFSSLSNLEIDGIFKKKKILLNKKIKSIILIKKINYNKKEIITEDYLEYLIYKKKISQKEEKNLKKIYIKFNINLSLKKKYDHNLKKKTNVSCKPEVYIYLSLLIKKIKKVKNIHKLNTILKIHDLINYKKIDKSFNLNFYYHSLLYEFKLFKSFI